MRVFVGEPRFYSEVELRKHLRELIEGSGLIDIATAWLSNSGILDLLLSAGTDLKIRAVVGVGGFATDPVALKKLGLHPNVTLKIYGSADGPLFHPKLYNFQRSHFRRCLIGSMNLTGAGTAKNVESMLSFDDKDKKAGVEFERFWSNQAAIQFADFDLKAYEAKRKTILAAVRNAEASAVLDEDVAGSAESVTETDALTEGWSSFVAEIRAIPDGIDGYMQVLAKREQFLRRNWDNDFSEDELDLIFGITPYASYGRLSALKQNQGQFQGDGNRWKRKQMGAALEKASKLQGIESAIVSGIVQQLLDIPFCKAALATRLLVLARPDFFVVVNRKSFEGLRERFGMFVSDQDFDARKYVQLLAKIHSQRWFQSSEPTDEAERRLWAARTSLIDLLVYREKPGDDE